MYPGFVKQIRKKHGHEFKAKIALLSMKWAMETEKSHHRLLMQAKEALMNQEDLDPERFYLCAACGNLEYSDSLPREVCPICKHDPQFYNRVEVHP